MEPELKHRPGGLAGREWVWLALLSLAVVAVTDLPSLLARTRPPDGLVAVYSSVVVAWDYPQYVAAIRDAAETGSRLSINHFSTEPHDPVLLRPFYTGLGLVAGAIGLEPESAYRLAGYLGTVLLCVGVYLFAALFHEGIGRRFLALVVTLAISGLLGWLDLFSGVLPESFVGLFEQRSERPEYSTFLLLFHHPHLQVALALLLFLARGAVLSVVGAAERGRSWSRATGIGALMVLISLTNLFSAVTAGAFLAGFALLVLATGRARPLETMRRLLPPVAGASAGALASLIVLGPAISAFRGDPFWSATYGTPRGQETPSLAIVGFHLFFVFALALVGARRFFGPRGGRSDAGLWPAQRTAPLLVLSWIGTTAMLMVVPLGFQIRFAFGIQPILAVVATTGLVELWRICRTDPLRVAVFVPLIVLALATPLAYARVLVLSVRGEMLAPLLYRYEEEASAARWLQENTGPGDAVLSTFESGNYLGGQIPGRVFVGHPSGTLDFDRKLDQAKRFFTEEMAPEERRRLLDDHGIDYVFYGPFEDAGCSPESRRELERNLEPVFREGGATVYRVP